MTKLKKQILALTVILTVFTVKIYSEQVNNLLWDDKIINNFYLSVLGQMLYYIVPTIAVLLIFHRPNKIFSELGLNKDFTRGLKYAFLITLPMLLGYF